MLTKSIFILLCLSSLRNVDSHGSGRNENHNHFPGNRVQAAVITREKICNFTSNTFAGLSGKDDHPPDAEFVCAVCTDSATFIECAINASKCFPRIDVENKPKIPMSFCSCINSSLELNTSYTTYVSNGGMDICNVAQMIVGPFGIRPGGHGGDWHSGEHGGDRRPDGHGGVRFPGGPNGFRPPGPYDLQSAANPTGFMQYLNQSDPTLLAKLECCMSQKTGLFDSTGAANVTAWYAKADSKPDGTSSTAIRAAIDRCATDATVVCNVHNFMHCIMRICYTLIQTG